MTDAETAAIIRRWLEKPACSFSWPTDACGYDQHIKFVTHKNQNWDGGGMSSFLQFVSDYAKTLEQNSLSATLAAVIEDRDKLAAALRIMGVDPDKVLSKDSAP